jgi:hypothetical protein
MRFLPDTRVVVLQPGANDLRRRGGGSAARDANIEQIVSRLSARGIQVVMLDNDLLRAVPDQYQQVDGRHLTSEGVSLAGVLAVTEGRAADRLAAGIASERRCLRRGRASEPVRAGEHQPARGDGIAEINFGDINSSFEVSKGNGRGRSTRVVERTSAND